MQLIKELQSLAETNKRSMGVCVITENLGYLTELHKIRYEIKSIDLLLATRLTDERFRGIIDFQKAVVFETPTDEIQKALVS